MKGKERISIMGDGVNMVLKKCDNRREYPKEAKVLDAVQILGNETTSVWSENQLQNNKK